MMGTAPPQVLGKRVGGYLRRKIALKKPRGFALEADLGTLVGRALIRGGHAPALIEFKRGDDWEDWKDPRKVYGSVTSSGYAGLGGKVLEQAQFGGRLARDLGDYMANRDRRQPSAEVANFKLTPSSPNTARVTVGPDRRERRKKYEWEKVGTQRKIQRAILATAIPAAVVAGGYLHMKGGGSVFKGIAKVGQESATKTRDVASAIVNAARGKPFMPRASAKGTSDLQKRADDVVRKAAERNAGKIVDIHDPKHQDHLKK